MGVSLDEQMGGQSWQAPKLKGKSASEVMAFGTKSSRMVRGRTFWARGYCVSTVGLDEETIREYIRTQEKADQRQDEFEVDG